MQVGITFKNKRVYYMNIIRVIGPTIIRHIPATCDDPVLCTAMRNFSNVFFISGLEVTWSLIRQHQQEEDGKKVILKIHALEKIEEESDDEEDQEQEDDCNGEK